MKRLVALALLSSSFLFPALAAAQTEACVKPIAIPDRWDDVTGIPGYMEEGRRGPDWRNNGYWDHEPFTDLNGNGLYDGREKYVDGNGNGRYDSEAYDFMSTGYGPADFGLELVLHSGTPTSTPALAQYLTVAVNPGRGIVGGDAYRMAWAECERARGPFALQYGGLVGPTNQAMRDLIARDPNATWDPATQSVGNSTFRVSPRVWIIPVFDHRIPISDAANVKAVKYVAFFAERMTGPAEVRGRLLRVPGVGARTAELDTSLGPVPATPNSWGRLKATYR